MTQQTNGMPDLNYSEENFRDLYEVGVEVEKGLWLQIATMPDCKVKDELVKDHQQLLQALAKAKGTKTPT